MIHQEYGIDMQELHTVNEVLRLLKISRANLYRLIKEGQIRPIKIGDRTLFTEKELNRFIEDLEKKADLSS